MDNFLLQLQTAFATINWHDAGGYFILSNIAISAFLILFGERSNKAWHIHSFIGWLGWGLFYVHVFIFEFIPVEEIIELGLVP